MSKYQALGDHLGHLEAQEWRPTFHEIERMLGADLPRAARSKSDWWASEKGAASVWTSAGWSAEPNLEKETVTFRRTNGMTDMNEQGSDDRGGGLNRERVMERGREFIDTGREVFNTGREQALQAAQRAAPAVKKYGPWAALGAVAIGALSFITFRQLQKRNNLEL